MHDRLLTTNSFQKLDPSIQKMVHAWVKKNLLVTEDPRQKGKKPRHELSEYWRYRMDNYRIIA